MSESLGVFTGERAIPLAANMNQSVMAEHLCRYEFATQFAYGNVLDAACGSGYGSLMLAKSASTVTGVDIFPSAVDYAQTTYGAPNVRFLAADVTQIPIADRSFDVIVSFETIEHIADGSVALKEMQRLIRDNGTLVLSIPLGGDIGNKYHLGTYQRFAFVHFLRKFFQQVTIMYQHGVTISPVASSPPFSRGFPNEYVIAICRYPYRSDHPLSRELLYQSYRIINGAYADFIPIAGGLKHKVKSVFA